MVWLSTAKPKAQSLPMIEQILATGRLSRQDHLQLVSIMLSDQRLDAHERSQINRILDGIRAGTFCLNDDG